MKQFLGIRHIRLCGIRNVHAPTTREVFVQLEIGLARVQQVAYPFHIYLHVRHLQSEFNRFIRFFDAAEHLLNDARNDPLRRNTRSQQWGRLQQGICIQDPPQKSSISSWPRPYANDDNRNYHYTRALKRDQPMNTEGVFARRVPAVFARRTTFVRSIPTSAPALPFPRAARQAD